MGGGPKSARARRRGLRGSLPDVSRDLTRPGSPDPPRLCAFAPRLGSLARRAHRLQVRVVVGPALELGDDVVDAARRRRTPRTQTRLAEVLIALEDPSPPLPPRGVVASHRRRWAVVEPLHAVGLAAGLTTRDERRAAGLGAGMPRGHGAHRTPPSRASLAREEKADSRTALYTKGVRPPFSGALRWPREKKGGHVAVRVSAFRPTLVSGFLMGCRASTSPAGPCRPARSTGRGFPSP